MAKVIECPCGSVFRAETEEELVALAQQHSLEVHEAELTTEQALAMAHPE